MVKTSLERGEGGRRGEKEEESEEVTVRKGPFCPTNSGPGPSEESRCTGKGEAEWGPGCEEGVGWLTFQDSHFSILTATFMVACEWLRP